MDEWDRSILGAVIGLSSAAIFSESETTGTAPVATFGICYVLAVENFGAGGFHGLALM